MIAEYSIPRDPIIYLFKPTEHTCRFTFEPTEPDVIRWKNKLTGKTECFRKVDRDDTIPALLYLYFAEEGE